MLEVRGLTKRYLGRAVVSGVSFAVRPGEVLGFLGPNGAGKSTTLGMLAGLVAPSDGRVLYGGRDVADDLVAYKARVGLVQEEPALYPYLSGAEYLQLVGRLRGLEEAQLAERVERVLGLLGLPTQPGPAVEAYSKGMRQKVAVAAALLHDPQILLFDEPESGLDVGSALVFRALVQALAHAGRIVIYSSHVLEIVEKVASRVLILHQGRVVADDVTAALCGRQEALSLEGVFKSFVPTVEADAVAASLVSAIRP
jgi:ABC-2 type transport system ATP-binding protein